MLTPSFSFDLQQKQLKDKLGADWQLVIDWPSFEKGTNDATATSDAAKSDRWRLPQCVYERYCEPIGREMAAMDADTAEAVNEVVTEKKIVISLDPETVDARYSVKVGKTIDVLVQQDRLSGEYPYSSTTTITAVIEKTL